MSYKKPFSLWADFIERDYLDGEFTNLIKQGVINGATSNPAIFKDAILNSPAYQKQVESLSGQEAKTIYEQVAIFDIQKAADLLAPLYQKGDDGFVSIEIDPRLADDVEGSIAEGLRLAQTIDRANVMIKVPATEAGFEVMEALVAEGIAVNATLIFSKEQALGCAKAFENGFKKHGSEVATVISVFVSRFDRAIDAILNEKGVEAGLVGIYNAAEIYNEIEALHLPSVRVLFASTGVKGDQYPVAYYIDELIAEHSVNTAPVPTIKAYMEDPKVKPILPLSTEQIDQHFSAVSGAGVDLDALRAQLLKEGLEAFDKAFEEILDALK